MIDTGALITGLTNKATAEYLLSAGLESMQGVVYLDELDRQMVLLRNGLKVVKLAESGLAWHERFTFYDQVCFLLYIEAIDFDGVAYAVLMFGPGSHYRNGH